MELTQAFLLGIMVAWTPSLIVLAVLLRDCADPTGPCDKQSRSGLNRTTYGCCDRRR